MQFKKDILEKVNLIKYIFQSGKTLCEITSKTSSKYLRAYHENEN